MALKKTQFLAYSGFTSLFFIVALILFTTFLQPISWRLSSRTLLLANGAFAFACVASVTYLIQEIQLKRKRFLTIFGHLPPLEKLDRICYLSVIAGLLLSTLALLTVVLSLDNNRGDWSRQLSCACVVWILYLLQLFMRFVLCRRGRKSAYLSITCFSILLALYASTRW